MRSSHMLQSSRLLLLLLLAWPACVLATHDTTDNAYCEYLDSPQCAQDMCQCIKQNADSRGGLASCRNELGFIDYLSFYYCLGIPPPAAMVLLILFLVVFIYLVTSTTQEYFIPSLSKLTDRLKLSNNVTGVTFLAIGNASPDLFSSITAIVHGSPQLGIATLLGASLFLTTVVFTTVIMASISPLPYALSLQRRPWIRDTLFFLLAGSAVFFVLFFDNIRIWEPIVLLALYFLYVLVVVVGRWLFQRLKRKQREALGLVEDAEELLEVADPSDESTPMMDEVFFISSMRNWKSNQQNKRTSERALLLQEMDDDESDDEVELVHELPQRTPSSNIFVRGFHQLNESIRERTEWDEKNGLMKILYAISLGPLYFVRNLSIPLATSPGDDRSWNIYYRLLAVINPLFAPQLILVASHHYLAEIVIAGHKIIPVWALLLIVGAILSLLIFFTTKNSAPPVYYPVLVLGGLLMSGLWLYLISVEVVSIVRTLSRILRASDTIFGLTLLAWTNSIVDMSTNSNIAKQGFKNMAASACFASPIFSLLIGTGSGFIIAVAMTSGSYMFYMDLPTLVAFASLGVILVIHCIALPILKFRVNMVYGVVLLALYFIASILCILAEFRAALPLPF